MHAQQQRRSSQDNLEMVLADVCCRHDGSGMMVLTKPRFNKTAQQELISRYVAATAKCCGLAGRSRRRRAGTLFGKVLSTRCQRRLVVPRLGFRGEFADFVVLCSDRPACTCLISVY